MKVNSSFDAKEIFPQVFSLFQLSYVNTCKNHLAESLIQLHTMPSVETQTSHSSVVGGAIVKLNVGGKLFVTSAQTLTVASPNSFLAKIISGGLPSTLDDNGAYFIDRCPELFEKVLTFLRTKKIRLGNIDLDDMLNEADYYGVQPLIDRLKVCKQLHRPSCGNLAFCGFIPSLEESLDESELNDNDSSVERASCSNKSMRGEPVLAICATDKWIAVAYKTGVGCYSTRQFSGEACPSTAQSNWFQSTHGSQPSLLALKSLKQSSREERSEQLIVACVTENCELYIWQQSLETENAHAANPPVSFVGKFALFPDVNALVFAGRKQIVALSFGGMFAVWHYSRDFQQQKVESICSYDECGRMMFFGHKNGIIRYFNAETLPVRLEDNKIILTDLYHDQKNDPITALNVRLASNNSVLSEMGSMENHFYFEIAYGTASGRVNLISEHAETIGQGPQLLFSFAVHRSAVIKVLLSEQKLISNCADYNHVRCWQISRFRGLLSKNPLPMPLTSFKMMHLEPKHSSHEYLAANSIGPHMLSESQIWYLQKITPGATDLFVISALSGECLHRISSVDCSTITSFAVTEEWRRSGNPTQYVFTGHKNGAIQVWNMATVNTFHQNSASATCTSEHAHAHQHFSSHLLRDGTSSTVDNHSPFGFKAIKTKLPFCPTVTNELNPYKASHPGVDDILKMLDTYDISQVPLNI